PRIPSRARRKRSEEGSITQRNGQQDHRCPSRNRQAHRQRARPTAPQGCSDSQTVNTAVPFSVGSTWRGGRNAGAPSALEGPETETVEQLGHELLAFRAWVTARVLSHQPGLVSVASPGRAVEGAHYINAVASVLPRDTADHGSFGDGLVETNAC